MNYTKLVREYCKNNSGAIFDVSKLKNTEFAEVPYKTLLKILNRIEEEGVLSAVSKGVYFIDEKPVDEELIFDEYVDDGKGMFVGYQLFNDVGISDYGSLFAVCNRYASFTDFAGGKISYRYVRRTIY